MLMPGEKRILPATPKRSEDSPGGVGRGVDEVGVDLALNPVSKRGYRAEVEEVGV